MQIWKKGKKKKQKASEIANKLTALEQENEQVQQPATWEEVKDDESTDVTLNTNDLQIPPKKSTSPLNEPSAAPSALLPSAPLPAASTAASTAVQLVVPPALPSEVIVPVPVSSDNEKESLNPFQSSPQKETTVVADDTSNEDDVSLNDSNLNEDTLSVFIQIPRSAN